MHIRNKLEFLRGVLVRVAMRTSGLAGQGLQGTVVAGTPEVDIRPAFVVLPTGTAYSVLLGVGQLSGKKSFLGIAFLFSLWYNTMRWLNGTGSVDDMGL